MSVPNRKSSERPRELRRRVVLPARLRSGAEWSDACILNISSRGLLIQSGRAGPKGTLVELHRGDHVILARVMWREGSRAGVRSDERLPVEDIMSLAQSNSLRLVASEGAAVERRRRQRSDHSVSRLRGRALDFIGVAAIAVCLAAGVWTLVGEAFARPVARIEAALDGQS